ncbi:MAG: peptide chain release factor N(5)-glutamine methyltransferase [Bdellovibrionales bacterium]|nr:peptide chain release factor N(5)-glutamine methyltransferase [Bdellovibrionales bacterium]
MILREVLEKTEAHFKKLNFERPRFEAEMILSAALNWKRMELFLRLDYPLQETEVVRCRDFVTRRSKGEPLAYIEGQKEFYGYNFSVNKSVLVPRPETEHLVDKALELIKKNNLKSLLDIGTGSGCIPIAILKNTSELVATAVDISVDACEITKSNASKNEVAERLEVINSDFSASDANDSLNLTKFDIVTSNPPYISETDLEIQKSVKDFEPHLALFAKNNGLEFYQTWFSRLAEQTKSKTHFLFEIGYTQRQEIAQILDDLKVFEDIECLKDYSGRDRIIYCTKK